MINEMNDPSIASISECDMSSPLLRFSVNKGINLLKRKSLNQMAKKAVADALAPKAYKNIILWLGSIV
jgi:hypothetical protein